MQTTPADKGSTGIIWRESKWDHVSSKDIGLRFLITHLRARVVGDLRVLAGHFSCEPNKQWLQWEKVEANLALPALPLVVLADHNSMMVLG